MTSTGGMSGQIARRATVQGRVQGVWYRAGTAERARALGVRGHARNLDDGTVEVLAVGPGAAVDALIAWLWEGPPLAQVTGVVVEEVDAAVAVLPDEDFTTA
jgi:acylphosphatase